MATGKRAERILAAHKFARVIEARSKDRNVTVGGGRGFGSDALKTKNKMLAMISSKDQLVEKLSKGHVEPLIASAAGKLFDPRTAT